MTTSFGGNLKRAELGDEKPESTGAASAAAAPSPIPAPAASKWLKLRFIVAPGCGHSPEIQGVSTEKKLTKILIFFLF